MSASSRPLPTPAWREGDPILFREVDCGKLCTARPAPVGAVRDARFRSVVDAWEPDVAWLRSDEEPI